MKIFGEQNPPADAQEGATPPAPSVEDLDRRYRRPLINYFEKRIREHYDVEDLVQEVFLRLTFRAQLENIERMDGYVFQVAANVIRDRLRRRLTHRQSDHLPLDSADSPEFTDDLSPERVLIGREQLDRVVAALASLPAAARRVFVLAQFEDMNYEAIAAQLGLSVSGVRFLLQKAKAHVAQRMEQGT